MVERSVDNSDGEIIVVRASGIWTAPELLDHYTELQEAIERFRLDGKPVRVLSDLTKAVQQPAEIESQIQLGNERTFRDGDRVAVLTANDSDKMLLRTVAGAIFAVFSSRLAAEMWLVDGELRRPE